SNAGREAAATVGAGLDKLFEFLGSEETQNKLQTAAFLDREIAPYFDFAYMAQFVAGSDWERMSSEQRTALGAQLEARILTGLAERLAQFSDQKVRYLRPRPGKRGSVDVQVGLMSPGSYPAKLVFRMYIVGDGWKVFDVLAEGRSLLAFYRTAFDRLTAPRHPDQAQGRP
ncbi:MAG: ABC transporter substrate-binding protein, partial [Thiohalocapsa sp.]